MNKIISVLTLVFVSSLAFAEDASGISGAIHSSYVPFGIGLVLGLAALGGALGQGKAIAAALDSIGRNPSASGTILTPMIIGLVAIESLVIFAFAIAYLLLTK